MSIQYVVILVLILLSFIPLLKLLLARNKSTQVDGISQDYIIEINGHDKKEYVVIYKVVRSIKTSYDDYEKFVKGLITLASKINSKIILSSIISKEGYNTYVIVLSDDIQLLKKDSLLLPEIVSSITSNIKLSPIKRPNIYGFYLIPLTTVTQSIRHNRSNKTLPTLVHYRLTFEKNIVMNARERVLSRDAKNKQGLINLGTIISTPTEDNAYLYIDDILRHVYVVGSTGSGKTTTVKRILYELLLQDHDTTIIVFDWHSEYKDLIKYILSKASIRLRHRIFTPGVPGKGNIPIPFTSCGGDVELNVSILESVLELTTPQVSTLIDLINSLCKEYKVITALNILEIIKRKKNAAQSRSEIEILSALHRKIFTLTWGQGLLLFNKLNEATINDLFNYRLNIIDLSHIINPRIRILYTMLLLEKIYELKMTGEHEDNVVIVIEEFHNYQRQHNVVSQIIPESRKYGLGLILVNQNISDTTTQILSNTNTKIIHRIVNPSELKYLIEILGKELGYTALNLDVGEAILIGGPYLEPTVVKIHGLT